MIPRPLFFILLLILFSPALARDVKNDAPIPPNQAHLSGEFYNFFLHADGSMYFPEDWNEGKVTLITGEVVEANHLRYNGYLDELIWLNPANFQNIRIDKQMVHSFNLRVPYLEDTLYFENIVFKRWFDPEPINIYGQIMYWGKLRLLVHRRIISKREVIENRGHALFHKAQLKFDPVYYILMPDNRAREIKRFNRKSLYRIFPAHVEQIKDAFRRHRLRIRNEDELIEAVKLIDHIIEE